MKQLRIEEKNRARIVELISEAEGNSTVNCLSMSTIEEVAHEAECRLQYLGIPKNLRKDAKFTYIPSGPTAKSYGFQQGATALHILRSPNGWQIEKIERTKVYPQKNETMQLSVTEAQREIAVNVLCKSFTTLSKEMSQK